MAAVARVGAGITRGVFFAVLGLTVPSGVPGLGAGGAAAQEAELQARIWLDRSADAVYSRGDRARVYYRVSEGAYVAIFRIDTDGRIRLLHPTSAYDDSYVSGGRDYRLLFSHDRSPYWRVDDDPGKGYYFIVASPEPMDFSIFDRGAGGGWDLASVGRTVYSDPYVAIDDYVARLIPDWEVVPYALDFTEYNVDRVYDYPRFLCYDCHHYRPYGAWNPYAYHCTSFRVVIYNDPYYYPVYRYPGTRVVFVRPPRPRQPRFVFKERAAGESWRPVVTTRVPGGSLDGPPRRVAPGDTPTGGRDEVGAPRRPSGATPQASPRRGTPVRRRDPVLVPRLRPSDPVRSGSEGSGERGRGKAGPSRVTPPPVRKLPSSDGKRPTVSKPPSVRRSSPPPTRSIPRATRSKPKVKKRGGGGDELTRDRALAPTERDRTRRGRNGSVRPARTPAPSSTLRRVLRGVLGRGPSKSASGGGRRATVRRSTGGGGSAAVKRSRPVKARKGGSTRRRGGGR